MDDPRLVHCEYCGNQIMVVAGDRECHYCHEPLPKPCPLADSDRARFTNLAGAISSMLVQGERIGEVSGDMTKIICGTMQLLAEMVGIDHAELAQAATSYSRSKDPVRWLDEMTQI